MNFLKKRKKDVDIKVKKMIYSHHSRKAGSGTLQ